MPPTESLQPSDSTMVSIKEYYLGSTDLNIVQNWDIILCVFLGATICFATVAANRFYFYFDQREDLGEDDSLSKRKFEHVELSWWGRLNSLIFKICAGYGAVAASVFLMMFFIEFTSDVNFTIPKLLALKTNNRLVDLAFAGFAFGAITYPLLSAKFIGKYGLDWLIDLIAQPKDERILDDIDNSKLAYLRRKLRQLNKMAKPNGTYGLKEFKYHITTWNDIKGKIDPISLELALDEAEEKYPTDLVSYILFVSSTLQFSTIRSVLNFQLYARK